jgi:hypothetical protein
MLAQCQVSSHRCVPPGRVGAPARRGSRPLVARRQQAVWPKRLPVTAAAAQGSPPAEDTKDDELQIDEPFGLGEGGRRRAAPVSGWRLRSPRLLA